MLDIKEKRHITVVGRGGASNVDWDDITNKPDFAEVATSGDYDDLTNKPELFSGDYNDLTNKPDLSHFVEDTDLATVATTGSYNDLSNKPTIPAAQVNSDWNSNSGVSQILNKPDLTHYVEDTDLATVATTGSYNDLSNTPAMTTETLTFTLQGGTTVTLNVYVEPSTPTQTPYFYVEDLSGSDSTLTVTNADEHTGLDFEVFCSTDQENWTSMGVIQPYGSVTATVPANGKLYLKANTDGWAYDNETWYNSISVDADYAVGGNIMSLLYGDNYASQTAFPTGSAYNFFNLFADMNATGHLISAEDLVLPATTLTDYCYSYMFAYCSGLTTAPELPATTLATGCYSNMFAYCNTLTTAPELPATTLAQNCYEMMFMECGNLNSVTTYAQDISATNCLIGWLDMVSGSGDFYNLGGANYDSTQVPVGWTIHTSL